MAIEAELNLPENIADQASTVLQILADSFPQCHIVMGEVTGSNTIDLQVYGNHAIPKPGHLIQVRDTIQHITGQDHTLGFESFSGKTSFP